jgi:hypothetical protein
MADIELEVLSRAVMVGGIDQLIAAGLEPRHFVDPETRAVFETCKEHYANLAPVAVAVGGQEAPSQIPVRARLRRARLSDPRIPT